MIGFSGEVLKLLRRFSPAWKLSAINSCSYFYSNLKRGNWPSFKFLPCRGKSYFCQLSDLSKIRWCWLHFKPTRSTVLNAEYLPRGVITGVRHSFFSQRFLERVEGKKRTDKLHFRKHDKLLFCLSFAELFFLILCEAKNISLVFCKYRIETENTPLAFKKAL